MTAFPVWTIQTKQGACIYQTLIHEEKIWNYYLDVNLCYPGGGKSLPLYTLTEGKRKAISGGTPTGNAGDVTVSDGNHVYFFKRWGNSWPGYYAQLTTPGLPFPLSAGDEVRTVITFDTANTDGGNLEVYVRKDGNNNAVHSFIIANPASVSVEATTTVTTDVPANDATINICARGMANAIKKWTFDLEIYVNGVRYI